MNDNLITSDELADFLKVTKQTIYRWRKEGLPFKKIGRSIRFDLQEVKDWIKSHNNKNNVETIKMIREQRAELGELFLEEGEPPEDLLEAETFIHETETKILNGIKITEEELEEYKKTASNLNHYNTKMIKRREEILSVILKAMDEISYEDKPINMKEVKERILDIKLRRI